MSDRRELMLKVFRNESAERVPTGFWFHFLPNEAEADGLANPELLKANIAGHRKFYTEFKPDFVKIMSDGLFIYPNDNFLRARSAADFRKVRPLGKNHKWIEKQIELVREVTAIFNGEVLSFYNVFAPATLWKILNGSLPAMENALSKIIALDAEAVRGAFAAVAEDLAVVARRVTGGAGADGIYYSTQDIAGTDRGLQDKTARPADEAVLNASGSLNILHICGYAGHRNELVRYADYPAHIINWAAVVEGVPLGEGKKLFGGKPVIGGFGNTKNDTLYKGTREQVEAETSKILAEAGRNGVVLGADCTVPQDISFERFEWVREAGR